MTKSEIRSESIEKRRMMSAESRHLFNRLIFERAHKLKSFLLAESVHIYKSTPFEAETDSFFEYAFALNKRVYVPLSDSTKKGVPFTRVNRLTVWKVGKLGIPHPVLDNEQEIEYTLRDGMVVIVPLVGFSADLHRVGYGAGYYDRLLENFNGVTIGLAYECQKVPVIPIEPHDRPLSYIVTERHTYSQ